MTSNNTTTSTTTATYVTASGREVSGTTMNVSIDVRDTLNDYREAMGFKTLGDAIQFMLIEAGYDMPLPRLVAGLEWADDAATAAA